MNRVTAFLIAVPLTLGWGVLIGALVERMMQ